MNLKILQAILEFLDSDGFKNTSYRLKKNKTKNVAATITSFSGQSNASLWRCDLTECDVIKDSWFQHCGHRTTKLNIKDGHQQKGC